MQVFVCGMHRSGTSMVARLLNLFGIYFGPEGSGLPANRENPKGFWERRDVVELNDQLLAATQSVWFDIHAWLNRGPGWRPPQHLVDALGAKVLDIDAHRPWFLKDPRLCLTLPYWLEHCERPAVVVCSRSPRSVIASLARRTEITGVSFSLDEAVALWEAYTVELLRVSAGVPRVFVRYEDVLDSPWETCVKLVDDLTRLGLRVSRDPDRATVAAFVDGDLQRSGARAAQIVLPDRVERIDAMLRDGQKATGPLSGESNAALAGLRRRLWQTLYLRRISAALALKRGDIGAALALRTQEGDEAWSVDRLRRMIDDV